MKKIVISLLVVILLVALIAIGSKAAVLEVSTDNIDALSEDASQAKIIKAATKDYNAQEYTIGSPFMVTDLFNRNALSAYVAFPIEQQATYSYTVKGKDKNSDFTLEDTNSQSDTMVVPVIGLYADYQNDVEITVNYKDGKSKKVKVQIETGSVDENIIPNLDIDTSYSDIETATESLENGLIFTAMGNAYDINGEIRVALGQSDVQTANPINLNADGSYLQMYKYSVESIDFTGRTLATYEMTEGYKPHHDMMSASNGYTYVLTSPEVEYEKGENNFNEGHLAIYKTGQSGLPIKDIDLNTAFIGNKVNDAGTNQDPGTDLMHLNSVDYYEPTNSIIVSSQTMNLLAAFDADTFKVQWTTADVNGQGKNASKSKMLEKLDSYVASNGQHNSHVTYNPAFDDGDESTIEIQLFDNLYCVDEDGNSIFAKLDPSIGTRNECTSPDSKLLVYRVDTKNMTVDTIYESSIEGVRSSTQASWYTSPSYKYNTISYTQIGTLYITDQDNNVIFTAANPEGTTPITYSTYRGRVLSNEQIQANVEYASKI